MHTLYRIVLALVLAGHAAATECIIAEDGMAVVDGRRTFILGLYENPEDDGVLKDVAETGFNLVYAKESAESLDRLHSHGLYAWLNTGYRIDLSADAAKRRGQLDALASAWSNHPALLVWEVPDEALWNAWYGAQLWRERDEPQQIRALVDDLEDKALAASIRAEQRRIEECYDLGKYAEGEALADAIWVRLGKQSPRPGYGLSNAPERAAKLARGMREGYAHLRAIDPAHPVWMNHAPRNQISQLAAFNEGADIVGCDIYPIPRSMHQGHSDIAMTTAAAVGEYTERMQAAAPGKPVWMVLQGFGWADIRPDAERDVREELRRPTFAETRFMAYDAIVRGARGILYWGTSYVEKDASFWRALLKAVRELADLEHVLAAPDASSRLDTAFEETYGSVDRALRVLPKDVDGKLWIIAVNEWASPLSCIVSGLPEGIGAYRDVHTGDEFTVKSGQLRMKIRAESARVLEPIH